MLVDELTGRLEAGTGGVRALPSGHSVVAACQARRLAPEPALARCGANPAAASADQGKLLIKVDSTPRVAVARVNLPAGEGWLPGRVDLALRMADSG